MPTNWKSDTSSIKVDMSFSVVPANHPAIDSLTSFDQYESQHRKKNGKEGGR